MDLVSVQQMMRCSSLQHTSFAKILLFAKILPDNAVPHMIMSLVTDPLHVQELLYNPTLVGPRSVVISKEERQKLREERKARRRREKKGNTYDDIYGDYAKNQPDSGQSKPEVDRYEQFPFLY